MSRDPDLPPSDRHVPIPVRDEGEAWAALEPDEMRSYLLASPLSRGGRLWCDEVIAGCQSKSIALKRACLRLFSDALKWTGGTTNILVVLQERLGVANESELTSLVASGRKMKEITERAGENLSEYRENAVELLMLAYRDHPEWRIEDMKRLSSGVRMISETNGDSH